jgi:outer membrane lipoprotein SlyB
MRIRLLAAVAVLALSPAVAFGQATTAGGAVGGAVIGGAVGGPVGAVVGAGVGSTVGLAAEPPAPVAVQEEIAVGQPLPATVELHTVPQYSHYSYAVVNHKRVIVEPQTRKVVKIVQ